MTTSLNDSPKTPTVFEDYFEMGQQQNYSPFLKPSSRQWGINLTLKSSLLAAGFLLFSFGLSFFPPLLPLSYFFLILVYFLAGIPSLIESIEDLLIFEINIDVLMTLAAFSSVLIGSGFEGALLLVLFAVSGSMEDAVTSKAKNAISSLHKLSPTRATVVESNGHLLEKAVSDIKVGTLILVKSGQIVPLDGEVVEGRSSVNLVHLTGENLPVSKGLGDTVPAGARNLEGALTLQITRSQADSTLSQIIQLVTQAQEARPKLQRWFDQISETYAIGIISFSFLYALTLPFIIPIPFFGMEGSIYRSLTFLIAASPCALIIAIPIAYLSSLSICAKKGIVLKGGVTLDALAKCKMIVFDKTGTLTTGELSFKAIRSLNPSCPIKQEQALAIAFALEKNAVHPIAKAIVLHSQSLGIAPTPIEHFIALPGQGLQGQVDLDHQKYPVFIGQPEFAMAALDEKTQADLMEQIQILRSQGFLIAVLTIGSYPFLLNFIDTQRPRIKETLASLHLLGLNTVMLTGDHRENAERNAKEIGIGTYYAELKPEDKLSYISYFSNDQHVAMVGDGINDAPALARATVGIAMGKVGNTAALDAADIILLQDNIEILDWLFKKARQTQEIVKENLAIAIGAMLIAVIPSLFGFIPLWLAVVLHEGGTVLVGLNALRLLRS